MPQRRVMRVVGSVAVAAFFGCSKRSLSEDASAPGVDANGSSDIRVAVDGSGGVDVPLTGDGASSFDAPSNVCPQAAPTTGRSCAGQAFGLVCSYAEASPSTCSTRCECRGNNWICDRACSTGACPANPPANNAPCSPANLTCVYPTACGERRLQCNAFEIGAPAYWFCSNNCSCDAGVDAVGADALGGVPCGDALTCTGTDVCIQQNVCGGPAQCNDVPDGGQCPPGSTFRETCATGRPACVPDCPPPTFQCKPKPAACTGAVNCSCLGASFCPLGACALILGETVLCATQ